MTFDPFSYAIKKQFGSDNFIIRPAKIQDRDLVWKGYKNAPEDFWYGISPITKDTVNCWYPVDGSLDFNNNIPINIFLLKGEEEVEFAGNMTLLFFSLDRFSHRAMMGIGVLPKFQGRGLGKYLTELSVEIARARPGIGRLELEVVSSNHSARHIYSVCGYKEEGVLRKKWHSPTGKYEDMIVMSVLFPEKIT